MKRSGRQMKGSGRQASREPDHKHRAWETNEKKYFFSFVSQARCLWSGSRLACLPLPFICLPLLFICLPVLFICLPGWVLVVGFPAGLSPTSFHLGSHFLSFVSHFFSFVSHFFSFVSQFFSFVSQAGYHLCNGPNQQGKNAA